jgi:Flp pilus assembly protein TadG
MKNRQGGLTTVEFAIIAAVFFLVLFGVIEIGRALFVWNTLTEATRRGARVAAVCGINHPAIARVTVFGDPASATNSPILSGLSTANVAVDYLQDDGVTTTTTFRDIEYVRVRIIGYQHNVLIPFASQLLTAPPFETTLPKESLGVTDVGINRCDFL